MLLREREHEPPQQCKLYCNVYPSRSEMIEISQGLKFAVPVGCRGIQNVCLSASVGAQGENEVRSVSPEG